MRSSTEPTSSTEPGRAQAERGAATVWAAGVIAVLMSVAVFGLHLGGAILARHHAESAADLAALAGAASVVTGERQACAQARRVTDRMRVRLVSCLARGGDLLVQVAARPGDPLGSLGDATGRARAGPVAP
ncbi:MAG: Rv3654c family TadE-like protein [Pseudonocardiaceae bacterium]